MIDIEDLRDAAQTWLADDPDPETRRELEALIAGLPDTADELADRFAGPLTFGTAGLRGPMRAGPNGMNRAVVRAAAAGLVSYLDSAGAAGPVVIGYDARHGSREFAAETASVVTGAGRPALVLPRVLPTPVLAYAIRTLGAAAGVVVTASHNPPADNGYKVYLADGAQIVPPVDRAIEAAIRTVGPLAEVPLGPSGEIVDEKVVGSYLDAVTARVDPASSRDVSVAYTPMHGVGGSTLLSAFEQAGFRAPAVVTEQFEPDPTFPTVSFPNPEEPGAVDLLLALAGRANADIAIANDPDADRCAVAIPDPDATGGWRMLHGDEVGILLADHLMRRGVRGTYATTIVSSSQLRAMCVKRELPYAETLTGFKWIVRAAKDLAYGYEEALGYAVAPDLVRDKDGISAALLVAELAAQLKASGGSLLSRLDELAVEFGLYATDQLSARVEDLAVIAEKMAALRELLPEELLGRPIDTAHDLLPDADVVILRAEGLRVVVRPSGTEPKLKVYMEVVVPVTDTVALARAAAAKQLAALRAELITGLELD
jgi:phosphomannomutase